MGASLFVKSVGLPPLSPQQKDELERTGETILAQIKRDTALIVSISPIDAEVVALFDDSVTQREKLSLALGDFTNLHTDNMFWLLAEDEESPQLGDVLQLVLPCSSAHGLQHEARTFDVCTDNCPRCPLSFSCMRNVVPFAYSFAVADLDGSRLASQPKWPFIACNMHISQVAWLTARIYHREDRRAFLPSLALTPNERMLIGVKKLLTGEYVRFTRVVQIEDETINTEEMRDGKRDKQDNQRNSNQGDTLGGQCAFPWVGERRR